MAPQTDESTEPRVPLSRERVLRAAIALADTAGIDALTMRRLGQELGVEAMSLYNHVANKDDILSGIYDLVTREIELPAQDVEWKVAIRASALSAYQVLLRHRWTSSLLMVPTKIANARLEWMEGILRSLREAGFSPELTCHAYHAIDSHVTGFALWQFTIPFTRADLAELGAKFLQRLPNDDFPYTAEHIQQHLNDASLNGMDQFEFGLDLILDGLERMRDAG